MGRTKGARNADYLKSRDKLVTLLARTAKHSASFRALAVNARVSPATLRNYFGDREGVLDAVLAYQREKGNPYRRAVADAHAGDVRTALTWVLEEVAAGWRLGLGKVHALGLCAGLDDAHLGPSYVNEILEPTLQSVEARIQRHIDSRELRDSNVRYAALALLSPLLLGLIHQHGLFGSKCRPLDLKAFIVDHVEHFVRAYER